VAREFAAPVATPWPAYAPHSGITPRSPPSFVPRRLAAAGSSHISKSHRRRAHRETLPITVKVTSMTPSATPSRTGIRKCRRRFGIYSRCRIDRVFFNHYSRWRYNDGAANHDRLGNDRSCPLDNHRRRSAVLVRPRIALAIACYRQIGGHRRRGKSECSCCTEE
jgi:hypothetical protein